MKPGTIAALLAGPLICLSILLAPTPVGLPMEGQRAMAVLALCVVWWLLTPVALPVTSLVGLALLPILGALPAEEAFALFGNQAVFFVIGVFLVAAVMLQTGLSARITFLGLRRFTGSENRLCYAVLLVSWGLCFIVVSHAVAALMLPIVLEIIRALDLGPRSRTARRLLLSMAWGTVCGSNLTLLSSARATLAVEMYTRFRAEAGLPPDPIGFLEYTTGTLTIALAGVFAAGIVLRVVFPPEGLDLAPAVKRLDERVRAMGKTSRAEWTTLAVVGAMVTAVVAFGQEYGMGTVALLFSGILFAMQVLRWEDAERYVNWGVALMYGGAIAVGTALHTSGATEWLMGVIVPHGGMGPWPTLALLGVTSTALTEMVSNSAVIAVVLPVFLPIAEQVGLDPRAMAWMVPVCAGFAFVLPTSTPALAMVFGTGYLRVRHTMPGLLVTGLSIIVFLLTARFIWPLIGIPVVGVSP